MCGREVTYNREIHNMMVGGRYYVAVENYIHETCTGCDDYIIWVMYDSWSGNPLRGPQEIEYSWII